MKREGANKNRIGIRKAFSICISALCVIGVLLLLQFLLVPKHMGDVKEGALIQEYYAEDKDFDVVFIGDCEVYENIVPAVLWEEYGINSYIRGSAQQLIWQSYYLMEETFTYEKPDVVVFNVLSMKYNEPQKEAYNRMTLEGMHWCPSKVSSIEASMTEEECFIDYVFPLLRYHSRWSEISGEDFEYLFHRDTIAHNGYFMQVGVEPVDYVPEGKVLGNYDFGENAYSYLNRMVALCKKNDVELVLMKAPSLYPYWYEEWEVQIEEFATQNNLKYINFLEYQDEIGIDYTTDTYDAGLHLNLNGATKLTNFFGEYLQNECGLEDRREDEVLALQWAEKLSAFEEQRKILTEMEANENSQERE